jgi:hypothetical protein
MYSEYDTFNNKTVEHFMWDWFKGDKGDKGDQGNQGYAGDPAADIRFGNLNDLTVRFNNTMTPWNKLDIKPTSLYGDNVTDPSKNDISGNKYITMSNMMFQNPYIVPKDYGENATIRYGKAGGVHSGTWWESGVKQDGNFQIFKENDYNTGIILNKQGRVDINNDLFIKGIKANNIVELIIYPKFVTAVTAGIGANKFMIDIDLSKCLGIDPLIKTRVINLYAYNTIGSATVLIPPGAAGIAVATLPSPVATTTSQPLDTTATYNGLAGTAPISGIAIVNAGIYTGFYNIIYNGTMALQRLTKTREDPNPNNTQSTFDIIAVVGTTPASDYGIIRYSSLNNRPVTVILELIS